MITQRLKTYLPLVLLLVLVAVLMSGCSGSAAMLAGNSWPGITVSGDSAYVAYAGQVFALDVQSGAVQWAFPEKAVNGQTFFAPPAAAGDLVVVNDYRDSLFALDPATGEQQWFFKSSHSRFIGGAVIGEDLIYAATVDGIIHALDRKTGAETWSYATGESIWSTPLLADGTLYITSLERRLYVLDAKTGGLSWQFSDGEGSSDTPPIGAMVGTPTLYEGVLYFGSFNDRVYAVSTETHDVLWTYKSTNWVWSSPVIDEPNGQVIGADLDGHIFALSMKDGSPVWTHDASGPVVGEPLLGELADGTSVAYITCGGDPNLLILDVSDGNEVKSMSLNAEFTTRFIVIPTGTDVRSIPLFAPPVGGDNLLLIGAHQGDNIVYALEREDLQEVWRFNPTAYAQQQKEAQSQGQEEPTSFFSSPMNILLFVSVALLMFTLFGRGRNKK